MKLTRLEIKNYRSLFADDAGRNLTLDLGDGVNTIVGPNNCGKSNIFRALALALDPDFRFDRSLDMPAAKKWSKPTVTLTFEIPKKGRSSPERTLLKYLEQYEQKANPKARATFAGEGIVKLRVTIEGGEDSVGSRRSAFVASGAGARTLPQDDDLAVKALRQFDKCFHFVLVPSGESLQGLLEGKFQDLMHNVLREHLASEYEGAEESRNQYMADLRKGLLQPLRSRIQSELADLFPEISDVHLRPAVRQLDETLTHMSVDVVDVAATDLADKGTGVRGGLIVAMLRHFAETGRRSMLFAVEEPESFLHPAAQENLRDDLEALADRNSVSLLLTSHSPYVVSRRPQAKVFALDKDVDGRTVVAAEAAGDEHHAGVLGGLFRDRLVVGVLDQASRIPKDAKAVLVVEGTTDEDYFGIAADAAHRRDLLEGLSFVPAGTGIDSPHAGGAMLAVMQALIADSTTGVPVAVLFDNDDEGREAAGVLRAMGKKTGQWKKGKTLFSYASRFDSGTHGFPYEAEDLWPNELFEAYLEERGEAGVLKRKERRPKQVGGWQYDLVPMAKGEFVVYVRDHADAKDAELWVDLLEDIRDGIGLEHVEIPEDGEDDSSDREDELQSVTQGARAKSTWPLPGGRAKWKQTLDSMIEHLAANSPLPIEEAGTWLRDQHARVRSDKLAQHYWNLLVSFGAAQRADGRLVTTGDGAKYAQKPDRSGLADLLTSHVWGIAEVLDFLSESDPDVDYGGVSSDDLWQHLNALGADWQTDAQVQYRLQWLAHAGLVRLVDGSWFLIR